MYMYLKITLCFNLFLLFCKIRWMACLGSSLPWENCIVKVTYPSYVYNVLVWREDRFFFIPVYIYICVLDNTLHPLIATRERYNLFLLHMCFLLAIIIKVAYIWVTQWLLFSIHLTHLSEESYFSNLAFSWIGTCRIFCFLCSSDSRQTTCTVFIRL